MMESCLARKDRLRPWLGDILKCPENGLLKRQNRETFLGQLRKRSKMLRYARVSTDDQQTLVMQNRAMREYAARQRRPTQMKWT
jgi:predicted site-specific integrase-resolvase